MAETFTPSGANSMPAIKDRITKVLTDATKQMSATETFAQTGRAAAQAATSDVTFGDALNAINAERLQAADKLRQFLAQEQQAEMAQEQLQLQRQSGDRAERQLGLQEKQFQATQNEQTRRLSLDWQKFRLDQRSADRADQKLALDQRAAATAEERAAIERQRADLKQHLAVSEAIERLVPEEQRTAFVQGMETLPYDVDSSNVVRAIGDVRANLEASGDLPPVTEELSALEEKINVIQKAYGVTYKEAVGVATGVKGIQTDPQSGLHTVYDKLTGQGQLLNTPLPSPSEPEPVSEGQTLFDLVQQGGVTGATAATQEALSGPSGQLGGPVATKVIRARQIFKTEQQGLIRALSINPRFPVAEMQRIRQEMNIEPSFWDSPETLTARMVGVQDSLVRRLENEMRASQDISLPLTARQNAADAANNIRNFLNVMGEPPQTGPVDLTPEDEDLVNRYLQ